MDNFMMAMYDEPFRFQALIDQIVDYNIVVFQRLMDLGVDILHVSEDLGTQQALMISPEMFRTFFLPAYERMFSEPRSRCVLIDFHSCGCIQDIAADLIAVGVDILNPLQAKTNNQQHVKKISNGRMAVLGGIDSTIVLAGTPKDVKNEVVRAFSVLKPAGGWIAGVDQVIVGAPQENVKVLWETCWELCEY
jgi:uroporphyrinogen decarboxylase